MTLDFTKPESLQRRDGGEFRIYATDHQGDSAVVGAIKDQDAWYLQTWNRHGRAALDCANDYDLIPKPLRVTGWANVYPNPSGYKLALLHDSEEEARREAGKDAVGIIRIDQEIQL